MMSLPKNANRVLLKRVAYVLCGGILLFCAGVLVLWFNPYWRVSDGMFPRPRYAVNAFGCLAMLVGIVLSWFSAVALVFAIVLGRFTARPGRALVSGLGGTAALLILLVYFFGLSSRAYVEFSWDRSAGFTRFDIISYDRRDYLGIRSDNPIWTALVRAETEPEIRQFTRNGTWPRIEGWVSVGVWNVIPFAHPVALGSGGADFWNPDDPSPRGKGVL